MSATSLERDVERVCDLVRTKGQGGGRTIIGIAGPPASGKSTLAEAVVHRLNTACETETPPAALLPMDGYHLDNRILETRGLLARKGAPETFNALDFCDAVRRLPAAEREMFYPSFDRQMDLSIAHRIAIHPNTPIVVVEGNYLLLTTEPWSSLHNVFAATVLVCPAIETLQDRLQQRWIDHGLDRDAARHRADSNDLPNAALVIRQSRKADLVLTQSGAEPGLRYA